MKTFRKHIGAMLAATALLAMPACTDTWDDHYFAAEGNSATLSLWEQIEANPDLSTFAELAAKAVYYKDERHPLTNQQTNKPYTFKDLLQGTQILTVWAPENDAFSEEDKAYWLNQVEKDPYTLHQQLMGNCIALWRNQTTNGGQKILKMLNGKNKVFDSDKLIIDDIKLEKKDIAATNGTLHTTKSSIEFNFNIYEYLKSTANSEKNNVMRFHNYVTKTDTTYHNISGSIEGNPDEYGRPTYVDSAYTNTNLMFHNTHRTTTTNGDKNFTHMESFGANIAAEDSDFIMLVPTDLAWETAYEKLKKLYNYAPRYIDNNKSDNKTTISYFPLERAYTENEVDSIVRQNIDMDIISPLCFNAHVQPKRTISSSPWNSTDLIAASDEDIKFLLNTFGSNNSGDTLRSDENWRKTSLWEGKTKYRMSNGYGIISDTWDIPHKLYKPNVIIEAGNRSHYNSNDFSRFAETRTFSNETAVAWVDTVGRVTEDNFAYYTSQSDAASISPVFKLKGTHGENKESEVMSGAYDIYLVVVPDFYLTSGDTIIGDTVKHRIKATINYNNGDEKGKEAAKSLNPEDPRSDGKVLINVGTEKNPEYAIEYDGKKVEKILLFENFRFPYSYKNLRYCFPTLEIGTSADKNARQEGYKNTLCIDQIILVSKEDE
ncbi:MAG: hypothetical protein KBT12_02840 [Bacteroidales bacterium]|nr:hypothetical protein [Candidatus Physcousia equi]